MLMPTSWHCFSSLGLSVQCLGLCIDGIPFGGLAVDCDEALAHAQGLACAHDCCDPHAQVDRRHVDDFLLHHGYRNIDNLLDHLLHLPRLRDDFGHLNNLLALVRYMDVNMMANMYVVVAVLA